ncbi:MAG: hypothetical protein ACYC55_00295 [Candidatus Geothermincolia bacterium]
MAISLEREFQYYLEHQEELAQAYDGKFVVIKGETILGVYDSQDEAINETTKTEALGTFLVQKVSTGEESYTQIFHSRAAFVIV